MAAPSSRRQTSVVETWTPSLNAFMKTTVTKGESLSYTENASVFAAIQAQEPSSSLAAPDVHVKALGRLMSFGHVQTATVPVMLAALAASSAHREDRAVTRLVHYLVQLALGNGAAGTPLPLPAKMASLVLPKAVDLMTSEMLSGSWADLASDKSSFPRKQAALRALAAVTHASLTLRPDDATYAAGLFYTLTSLLDKLDGMKRDKSTLSNFLARQGAKKKDANVELRTRLEINALQRLAFSAARVGLSRSGIIKIALRSFGGVSSPDALGARHALALAALAARDPQGIQAFIQTVGPLLKNNVELARKTGLLYAGAPKPPPVTALQQLGAAVASAAPTSAAPVVMRDDPDNYLNLRDTWARIYLARACAVAIQSGYIAGDVANRGAVFWDALVVTACGDTSDLAALEAVRALFGAPYPKATASITAGKAGKQAPQTEFESEAGQSKVFAASWHMIMSQADAEPSVMSGAAGASSSGAGEKAEAPARSSTMAGTPSMRFTADAVVSKGTSDSSLFARLTRRLVRCLQSKSRSLIAAACRSVAVLAESRAWCMAMSGMTDEVLGSESVRRLTRQLQNYMAMVLAEDNLGACERAAAADALLWLQLPDGPALVTPGAIVRAMACGGSTAPEIVRATFADPWPETLVAAFLATAMRRARCSASMAEQCLGLVVTAAVAVPSRVPRELLLHALDGAQGTSGVRAAMELLSSPLPPLTQPIGNSAVEVKHLACVEEAAFEGIKTQAAWWLGEHVNQVASEQAWKPRPAAQMALLPAGLSEAADKLALAGAAQNPVLATVMAHLHRALLTGSWEVRLASAQALAKVGVRSGEPFRVQCYSLLASTRHMGTGEADPLGVAPVVAPATEVFDALYAGELVMNQLVASYGETPATWPKSALKSVLRRHEWLMTAVTHKICGVPRDAFLPLGAKSRPLVRPEEKEADPTLELAVNHTMGRSAALAAAAGEGLDMTDHSVPLTPGTPGAASQGPDEDGQYADYDYDYDYDYDGQYAEDEQYADPLEAYDGDAANGVAMQWGGVGEDNASVQGSDVYDTQRSGDSGSDVRYGYANYEFAPGNESEVAMAVGERVRVFYDMGGWYHITNAAGASGLVPSSYIQLEDDYDTQSQAGYSATPSVRKTGSPARSRAGGDNASEYGAGGAGQQSSLQYASSLAYDNAAYDEQYGTYQDDGYGDGGGEAFGGGGDNYYGGGYGRSSNAGAGGQEYGEAATPAAVKPAGGFDDFGSIFRAQNAQRQQAENAAAAAAKAAEGPGASTLTPAYSAAASSTYEANSSMYGASSSAVPPSPSGSVAPSSTMQPAPSSSVQAPLSAQPSLTGSDTQLAAGTRGTALYDFTAELENELTVKTGEEVLLKREVDGWYQATRVSDGVSGLLPASYVQLLE